MPCVRTFHEVTYMFRSLKANSACDTRLISIQFVLNEFWVYHVYDMFAFNKWERPKFKKLFTNNKSATDNAWSVFLVIKQLPYHKKQYGIFKLFFFFHNIAFNSKSFNSKLLGLTVQELFLYKKANTFITLRVVKLVLLTDLPSLFWQ